MFDALTCLAQQPEHLVLLSALIALVVLGIGFVVFVMHRRLVRQSAQTLAAVNYMPLGFCMFDANKRLVLCNNVYADMYRFIVCRRSCEPRGRPTTQSSDTGS
jgi:hypothetical protein